MTVMQESREQLPVRRRLRLPLAAQLQQLLLDMVNSAAALFSHYLIRTISKDSSRLMFIDS
jgi:hypothetical protein